MQAAATTVVMNGPKTVTVAFSGATYSISGQVTKGGAALPGVTLTLSGGAAGTRVSGAAGEYSFAGLAAGPSYTVTPQLSGHTFTPPTAAIVGLASSATVNFTAVSVTCSYTLSSSSVAGVPAAGGTATVGVQASSPVCAWPAVSLVPWVTAAAGGIGTQTLSLSVAANTGASRSGTLTVAGLPFFVTQSAAAGCGTFALLPASDAPSWPGRRGTTSLSGGGCAWEASSNAAWLQVYPLSGTGPASLQFTAFPNFTRSARTASISAAGRTFTVTQSGNPSTPSRRFVQLLYDNFLNRLPGDAEAAGWESQLSGGVSRADVANSFFNSEEFNLGSRFVAGLYVGLLNRDAEYGGWLFQRGAMIEGVVNPDSLVRNFIESAEFRAQNPSLSDADFVRLLYRQVLLREAAAPEVELQVNAIRNSGRVVLARALLNSAEFRASAGPRLLAFLLYATLVFRDATAGERAAAIAQLNAGTAMKSLMEAVIAGAEFAALLE